MSAASLLISSSFLAIVFSLERAEPALSSAEKPSVILLVPSWAGACACRATKDETSSTSASFNCPGVTPPQLAIQVIYQDPTLTSGTCSDEPACAAVSNCSADFPSNVSVNLHNCFEGGVWMKVSGYNSGAKFFWNDEGASSPTDFDLDISSCLCNSSNGPGPELCTKKIEVLDPTNDEIVVFTWKFVLKCAMCIATQPPA